MKEEILKLKSEGKSYGEIKKILNCSKGTISYHCGKGQKEKTKIRIKKRRQNILLHKVENFKHRKIKNAKESVRKFQKRNNNAKRKIDSKINTTFTWEDVLKKYGEETNCYLSGEKINLFENNYSLDHKIPHSKGGDNSLENLRISHKTVNSMKSDLTPNEFIMWCKKILEYNGFKIEKK